MTRGKDLKASVSCTEIQEKDFTGKSKSFFAAVSEILFSYLVVLFYLSCDRHICHIAIIYPGSASCFPR